MLMKLQQKLNNLKFRYKIVLVYVCIGFLPLLVISLFMFSRLTHFILQQDVTNAKNTIEQAVATINSEIRVYNNLSDYLSFNQHVSQAVMSRDSDYAFYESLTKSVDPMINSVTYFHTNIEQITIYAREDIVPHGKTLRPMTEIKHESWFQAAKASDVPVWFVDHEKKTVFSARNMPEVDRLGGTGILYVRVNYDNLFKAFSALKLNYSGLIVAEGSHVVYEDHAFDHKRSSLTLKACQSKELPAGYHMITKDMEDGWTVYYYYLNSARTNAQLAQFGMFALMVLFLSGVLAAIVLFSTSQMLVGRIEKLQKNVKAIEEGDLEVFVTSTDKDEIGELIRGFGLMINRIKFLIEEVYEANIRQKNYEMRALQQQINPHFLYNSLSMINFMALEVGQDDICKVTLALSDFYRTSLNKGRNTCSLADELKNMNAYLDIQLMMHDYEFDVDMQIDEEMQHYESLNLILQPIVENAIEHGIELLEDRKGIIKIYATSTEQDVYVMIEDNGVGMTAEDVTHMLEENSKGYGMRNVNQRIKLLYGEAYGLHIESVVGKGTCVRVKLPKKTYRAPN